MTRSSIHPAVLLVVFGLIFAVVPFAVDQWFTHAIILVSLALYACWIRLPWRRAIVFLPGVVLIIVSVIAWLVGTHGGRVIGQLSTPFGQVRFTDQGVTMASRMGLRGLIWLFSFAIILGTMSARGLLMGLQYLRVPRGPALAVSLTFAMWPLILHDAKQVVEAQRARGVGVRRTGNLVAFVMRSVAVIMPILFIMLRRVRTMTYALIVRGYGASDIATDFYQRPLGLLDVMHVIIGLCVAVGVVFIDRSFIFS